MSSKIQILRAADHRRMPWKNGGGVTTEIAVHPADADMSGFGWRVSMATVAEDGPFSMFPGIDRTLSILEGEGMTLSIDGRRPITLTTGSPPLFFAADVGVGAQLVSGPITDLNVMTRRGRFSHAVERLTVDGDRTIAAGPETTMLLALGAVALSDGSGQAASLDVQDCAVMPGPGQWHLRTAAAAICYRITITGQ